VTVKDPGGLTDTDSVPITVTATSATSPSVAPQASPPLDGGTVAPVAEVAGESRVTAPRSMNVRTAIRRGVRLRVSCESACQARAVLRISGERIGVSKRLRIRADGSRTVVVKLDRVVRRNLLAAMRQAGMRHVTATAITTITTDDSKRALPVKVTLRR
jgi:ribosomal protein L19